MAYAGWICSRILCSAPSQYQNDSRKEPLDEFYPSQRTLLQEIAGREFITEASRGVRVGRRLFFTIIAVASHRASGEEFESLVSL